MVRFHGDLWGVTGAGRPKVVHRELVPGAEIPRARLAELADLARAGAFAR